MSSRGHCRITLAFIATALLASVALNFVLYKQGERYYIQLNQVRLDPLGLDSFPIETSKSGYTNPGNKTVIFFGDSRAAQWPSPELEPFEFINRGVGAQTSAQTILRFDAHVKPLHPQVVVIQVGINDLKTIPLFPEKKAAIIANCKSNIQNLIDQAVSNGAHVILTTIFPLGQIPLERRPFWSDDIAEAIDDVNRYIASLKSKNVDNFDINPVLTDGNGKVKSLYSQDFLHLNDEGYETLNAELIHMLNAYER
jgi:lysophospholipase L1-like esterase